MFGLEGGALPFRKHAVALSKLLRHRGPDWNGIYAHGKNILCHERLAIVDLISGSQPLYNEKRSVILSVNGEIYNHQVLRKSLHQHEFSSNSDCEPILHLYEEEGTDFIKKLRGMYAFVLFDEEKDRYIAARDPIGIIPLYYGYARDGSMWFASEMKALVQDCTQIKVFPPGHYYDSITGTFERFYNPPWLDLETPPSKLLQPSDIRTLFENAVSSHLMSDAPFGVLLSGGLDSSLVASIAGRHVRDHEDARSWFSNLHTFAIGLEGSPDLEKAEIVAQYIGSKHSGFTFTIQEGIDALHDVIYHTETYDVTTIRASTPMYLMTRRIKATGVKMVLSGEGADEIFGGYLYFHKAPNAYEFFHETKSKIEKLHLYDCLRCNKAMSAFGVEARVPFLDQTFLDEMMMMDPRLKMTRDQVSSKSRIEKHVLRNAFSKENVGPGEPYLPDSVLWRQKEQFSDGVGYSWIDALKEFADDQVSDEMFKASGFRFPYNPPSTKEAYYYRLVFENLFPGESACKTVPGGPTVACSTPRALEWDEQFKLNADPSGRSILDIHGKSIESHEDH